ncbi:MAG: hypothetical protein NC033_05085 [Clostridiales bacterium]|nr:hypothetical protein [Clostridiales bacterium]
MNKLTKRIATAGFAAVFAATAVSGLTLFKRGAGKTVFAAAEEAKPLAYYYENLNFTTPSGKQQEFTLAKKFYQALDELNTSGEFKDGVVSLSLTENDLATSDQIKAWIENNDLTIPSAFSAARDSYYYDHPELFYVDLYKLTISAGRTNGVYTAYIDCGTEENCYIDGSDLNSESKVDVAITSFNNKISDVIMYARTEAAKDTFGSEEDMLLARYANEYIAQNVAYDFEAYTAENASQAYAKPFTGTAYGALVDGQCVCSGYSFAYKAVLDQLEIPCVVVSGYSIAKSSDGNGTEKGDAHSWNYVWLKNPTEGTASSASYSDGKDGGWYAYDVTWNSSSSDKNTYTNMSSYVTGRNHGTDPVISSSGYNMPYPSLSYVNYGNTVTDSDFTHSYIYAPMGETGGLDDYGNTLMEKKETVSYKGKGTLELAKEGLYIAVRYAYYNGSDELIWSPWADIGSTLKVVESEDESPNESVVPVFNDALYTQYAVLDKAPELNYNPDNPETQSLAKPTDPNLYYDPNSATDFGESVIYISETFVNQCFGTYTPAPYITSSSPDHCGQVFISDGMAESEESNIMADKHAFEIKITYDEKLHVIDKTKPVGVSFISEFANAAEYASFVPLNDKGDLAEIMSDGRTLRFKFKPSLMWEHNRSMYSFYFSNVGSAEKVYGLNGQSRVSDKLPNPAHYIFERHYMACPARLGGGRLWIECCAQPTLVSNTDLAAMEFTDENGNSTFTEQSRSQMMLVVQEASTEAKTALQEQAATDYGVADIDSKSATYDIDLQICGKVAKIKDGSFVKIALGFPEGYGPEDEGVTFKIYHRKHISGDTYEIEEVPCVVTKFGIVATVESFSPYMVVAVNADSVTDTAKTVYATIDGKGGTLSKADGKVLSIAEGGTHTYDFTPDAGYEILKVTLNGEEVSLTADNKLTVNYADLTTDNEIVVKYISAAAKTRYGADFELVVPNTVVLASNSSLYTVADVGGGAKNNTALIVSLCLVLAAVAAAAVIAVIVIKKSRGEQAVETVAPAPEKKPAAAKEPSSEKKSAPKTTAAKPAVKQTTAATAAATKPAAKTTAPAATKPVVKPVVKPVQPKSGTTKTTKK